MRLLELYYFCQPPLKTTQQATPFDWLRDFKITNQFPKVELRLKVARESIL